MIDIQPVNEATPDLTEENIDRLAMLFPDVMTEVQDPQTSEIKRAVDFDALRDKLGDVAEGTRERYQFTWPGKRAAKAEARKPIAKTLRPVKERSKNWDTTQNLYIEGDNLDALKILRKTYAGKIKLIYIDPPYNTGHDFIYKDNFGKTVAADKAESGDWDDEGGQLVANPESNGRFHSDWCSMIYPRLLLARDLLTSDGAIFISIDDNEAKNLENICDEVFGRENFITRFIWRKVDSPNDNHVAVTPDHEYVIAYCKNRNEIKLRQRSAPELVEAYNGPDSEGRYWRDRLLRKNGKNSLRSDRPSMFYPLSAPDGSKVYPIREDGKEGRWAAGIDTVKSLDKAGDLVWKERDGAWVPYTREYAADNPTKPWMTIWNDLPAMRQTKAGMRDLFDVSNIFDTPKPPALIERIIEVMGVETDTVLDFFSGSSSSAQAVMNHNANAESDIRYILVQVQEETASGSEAYILGFSDICELGEERIRRAGEKIKAEVEAENAQGKLDGEVKKVPDIGFRVLRVDSSSYEDVRKIPAEFSQGALDLDEDNTKEGRSSLDLLFECLPTFQLPYTSSIETLSGEPFDGYTVYSVNDGQLLACFDEDIPESLIRGMAGFEPKPSYVVVAEKSLPDSAARTNFAEIFKQSANAFEGQTQIRII
ncbi:site-specific DNA-methyltransferase [Bifidobacterium pullorum]|uniref:site-specific DNA-methyltransferase n=1 Tax=Bifidobacterium pullorum TaxID=78448 RepID=UPI00320A3A35